MNIPVHKKKNQSWLFYLQLNGCSTILEIIANKKDLLDTVILESFNIKE